MAAPARASTDTPGGTSASAVQASAPDTGTPDTGTPDAGTPNTGTPAAGGPATENKSEASAMSAAVPVVDSVVVVQANRLLRTSHETYSIAIDDGVSAVRGARECATSPCGFTVIWVNGVWVRTGVQAGTDQELMNIFAPERGSGVTVVVMHPTGRLISGQQIVGTARQSTPHTSQ
jgi:hypothetical protein